MTNLYKPYNKQTGQPIPDEPPLTEEEIFTHINKGRYYEDDTMYWWEYRNIKDPIDTIDLELYWDNMPYCYPICWSVSDFCLGHGQKEQESLVGVNCEICEEPISFAEVDDPCPGHSLYEIEKHLQEKQENEQRT